ncbi:TonB-dependent receptor [Parafilimonas sp.]|uniref:TonB-dependent receptor n=1 Tax=Parafilimonas sp. TaxID=1969739 RepID=UPI0039E289A1
MQKKFPSLLFALACVIHANLILAQQQTIITGNIRNSATKESLAAISVMVKGTGDGTYTDEKGNFRLVTAQKPPFVIVVSSIGYKGEEVPVESNNQIVNIELEPGYALGQEIVVAASRLPERILESPVTIERVSATAMRNTPGPNYYDALGNLKGVDVTTSSFTFKTVSTRGFNGSGNLRFNQLVDGMDNSAPALNFSVGNVIGLTDLDVDNMELLSGASSALYGSGGMNGTLLISSKDPFKYQGFSAEVKEGIMHVNDYRHKASPYHDIAIRWGKKVSDKFAFKFSAEYMKADDWRADDSTNLERNNVLSQIKSGTRASDPNYDGVNVYGDEASAGMNAFAQAAVYQGTQAYIAAYVAATGTEPTQAQIQSFLSTDADISPFYLGLAGNIYGSQYASRTGYYEKDLVNYDAYNFKASGGLYYKINSSTEASLTANWGLGTTVYTGADRYSLKNFQIGQYKLEVNNPDWFIRAYTTQENSGDSYATTLAALGINSAWKTNSDWFAQYIGTYSAYILQGADDATAHAAARAAADDGRYLPGTTAFSTAFKNSTTTSINDGGSQFADKSSLYQVAGQYNFSQFVKVMEVLAGASYRLYHLNSNNTIFYEPDGPINISEYGAYIQLQKEIVKDVLKLTAAGRYDKNENFKGRFTPRFTATITPAKNNVFRLSYQQAYRFPNNQDQWINLQTPGTVLIGCLPAFNTLYDFSNNPVYTAASVVAYRESGDAGDLVQAEFKKAKPETMESYEVGYRGIVNNTLLIDAYYYFSRYKDFIAREAVARGSSGEAETSVTELASPFTSTNYSFVVNSGTPVKANGWGISLEYRLGKTYSITGNVYGDQLKDVDEDLVSFFNTPKTRFNLGLSSSNAYKGIGFNVIYKWQDKVAWEGTFGSGTIPAFGTLDAQVSYNFTKEKVLVKIGGTNIINHYYRNAFGNPYIGALYYASIGYNVF